LHYRYAIVSFPAFLRLTFGKRVKFFLEGGAYMGFCVGGKVRYTYTSYPTSPGQLTETSEKNDSYNTGLFLSPAVSMGLRFPLLDRLDLFIKPEFAFVKNIRFSGNQVGSGYGGDYDYNYSFPYGRLCLGLHLKP
jgi:hypothetical protein